MLYAEDKIETRGAFVLPTTRAGRKLIRRCLRKNPEAFAGSAVPGAWPAGIANRLLETERDSEYYADIIPAFSDQTKDAYGKRTFERFDRLQNVLHHCGSFGNLSTVYGRTEDWKGEKVYENVLGSCFSRVLVRASWHHRCADYELEEAIREQEERWKDAKEAADAERERKRERERILREAREARKEKARLAERSRAVRVAVAFSGRNGNKIKQLRALGIVAG